MLLRPSGSREAGCGFRVLGDRNPPKFLNKKSTKELSLA
jgi:hypothetical protein